jgi:hypothetical protein
MKTIINNLRNKMNDHHKRPLTLLVSLGLMLGCTEQIPGAFRFVQQEELFGVSQQVNTKVDLLFVVDNSASMEATQQKLREGFSSFASQYLKTTWDIRIAVITTDTYLAHPVFTDYLGREISAVHFPGVTFNDLVPVWGPNFARLLPDYHDGPIPGLCDEDLMPYFYRGNTECSLREAGVKTGVDGCLGVGLGAGETTMNQCVNTTNNNTVRSGRAILSTKPEGGANPTVWINQLKNDFMINVTTGSVGHGSERGFSSVLQLLEDNEETETAFFRKDSLRGIIFVSDEDDQSMTYPANPAADFTPNKQYACDYAGLNALNGGSNGGYCCAGGACIYGDAGTTCPSVTVDGHTYTPSVCPDTSKLIPVADVKSEFDEFFKELDQLSDTQDVNSYFIVSIVPTTGASISDLQTIRDQNDSDASILRTVSVEYGARYIELANSVGNGSLNLDISSNNYAAILEEIGNTILTKKGRFHLQRRPTSQEEMHVLIVKINGTVEAIPAAKYTINEYDIQINDLDVVLSLEDTDRILINYQPKGAF